MSTQKGGSISTFNKMQQMNQILVFNKVNIGTQRKLTNIEQVRISCTSGKVQ